jgi:hypothetical protein
LGADAALLTASHTVSETATAVEFQLTYPAGSVVGLTVENAEGQRIGHDFETGLDVAEFPGTFSGRLRNPQIVSIPNAAGQTFTVHAELAKQFWEQHVHHVVVKAFEVPPRPAVLAVQPAAIEARTRIDQDVTVEVFIGEAGLEEGLQDVAADLGAVQHEGVELTPVTPSHVSIGAMLAKSGTRATFTLHVPEDAPAGDYAGDLTVSAANAGSLVVPVLVHVFSAGDLNCDGNIDAFDIDPFVLALTDPLAYAGKWPHCDSLLADINGDGKVDAFDIDPFVELLIGA